MFRSFVHVYQRVTYIEPSNIGKWGMSFFSEIHHQMEKKSNGEDTKVVLHSAPYCANDWIYGGHISIVTWGCKATCQWRCPSWKTVRMESPVLNIFHHIQYGSHGSKVLCTGLPKNGVYPTFRHRHGPSHKAWACPVRHYLVFFPGGSEAGPAAGDAK